MSKIDEEREIKILWRQARELQGQLNACHWNPPTREDPVVRRAYTAVTKQLADRLLAYRAAHGIAAEKQLVGRARDLAESVATIPERRMS